MAARVFTFITSTAAEPATPTNPLPAIPAATLTNCSWAVAVTSTSRLAFTSVAKVDEVWESVPKPVELPIHDWVAPSSTGTVTPTAPEPLPLMAAPTPTEITS